MKKTAVILVNLGTPETPTKKGVSRFLKSFLSDSRVVEAPKLIWWFVLRFIIIPLRAKKVAASYKKIWWDEGSPLRVISERQVTALQQKLSVDHGEGAPKVVSAVTYGEPSIENRFSELNDQGINQFIVVPMYPQYSGSTTGAIYDQLAKISRQSRDVPDITTIKSFYDHSGYIEALAEKVTNHWQEHGRSEKLLMSFHGIPKEYDEKGDPYRQHCEKTAEALAKFLDLENQNWALAYQSRFGPKEWLQPYTDDQLQQWINQGIKSVDVISPAFTADCLETLEELNIEYRDFFMKAGGESYHYISCVNDSSLFIEALSQLVKSRYLS